MTASATNGEVWDGCRRTRIPVLYLAPWVDFGGSDKGTIDWFRWLDRDRFAASLITTQPSDNRRLGDVYPFADEVWSLPEHFAGPHFPRFIFDFIHTRRVRILHIMNSRLGYELLPDLASLPRPPRVVVQLHVEEPDRSGYVRYVTSRYGNLVDGFSVTSEHLARAVEGYEIPRSRIHVIPTGVDAQVEFNPDRVLPVQSVSEPDAFRVLFPGRLVDQKDPLLMVEAIRLAAARHDHIRVDVVGDGPLEAHVRARINELGLGRVVRFHPPSDELARWLRASDLLLMTSVFEGVPYIIYEALAMGLPVVAPALPGNVELMADTGGILIDPRDDAGAYAAAIGQMIDDTRLRERLGQSGRERMLESFSLRETAAAHEALYDDLIRTARVRPKPPPPPARPAPVHPEPLLPPSRAAPLTFRDRPTSGAPLVSVITPCFNHGAYLEGFLDALGAQEYPALELIIVDDGSTDAETIEVLDRIDKDGRARVIRQERNRGPSVARNRGLAAANGRYILPVDADNLLLPNAVQSLVTQLQAAGEQVGYIYPRFQYFGTRDYRFDPPAYNLFLLLQGNFTDTCSLLDRQIFDAGVKYPEDLELGHEDWDLALSLGALGVVGQPSREVVMLYRKQGFTRSDLVEYLRYPFWREVQHRHPELFGDDEDVGAWGRFRGPAIDIKAEWNPGLSIVLLDPTDFDTEIGFDLLRGLAAQSCRDFELIAECPRVPADAQCVVRRLPPGLSSTDAERAQEALDISRGRYLLLTRAPWKLFADVTAVEKLLRGFAVQDELDAVALADFGLAGRYPFRRLDGVPPASDAHTIAWRRDLHERLPSQATVSQARPAADLADFIYDSGAHVHWRHFPGSRAKRAADSACSLVFERPTVSVAGRAERETRFKQPPALPAAPADCVPRWDSLPTWMPPETVCLARHREVGGERRVITNDRVAPPGFSLEFDLGSIQHFAPPGTARLVCRDGCYSTEPRGTERDPTDIVLGYLEEAPLPLFVGVLQVSLPDGSQTLVLASERDPLHGLAMSGNLMGFIEAFPNEPVFAPRPSRVLAPSLMRRVDRSARRHVYDAVVSADELPGSAVVSAELGVLATTDGPGRIALWADAAGHLRTERYSPAAPHPSASRALRWAAAPATWRDIGYLKERPRAIARRSWDVAATNAESRLRRARRSRDAEPRLVGYLHTTPSTGRIELFAATHPVLDDQFITHHRIEATDMGYEQVASLGFIDARAPVTGTLGTRRVAVPWASRLGLRARRG